MEAYEELEIEVIAFTCEDVITTSDITTSDITTPEVPITNDTTNG